MKLSNTCTVLSLQIKPVTLGESNGNLQREKEARDDICTMPFGNENGEAGYACPMTAELAAVTAERVSRRGVLS